MHSPQTHSNGFSTANHEDFVDVVVLSASGQSMIKAGAALDALRHLFPKNGAQGSVSSGEKKAGGGGGRERESVCVCGRTVSCWICLVLCVAPVQLLRLTGSLDCE